MKIGNLCEYGRRPASKYGSLGFLNVRVDFQLQITILSDTILGTQIRLPGEGGGE